MTESRRTLAVLGTVAVVLLLVVAAGFGVRALNSIDGDATATPIPSATPQSPTPTGPRSNTGPFTGVYRVDFGRVTTLDGATPPGGTPLTSTYGIRSACGGNGCVATASMRAGDRIFSPSVVFDKVGDSWLSVTVDRGMCRDEPTETWQVFRLTPHPDGTLVGEHLRTTANRCAEKRTVTFTRTGDVDVDADLLGLPDPAALPARVVSPAEALRGRYRFTRTYSIASVPKVESETATTTDCLRTGDRCMSYFVVGSGDLPLVFQDGTWTATERTEGPCPSGDPSRLTTDISYPLPQPPQNPVAALTGTGRWVQSGSCAVDLTYTETFTRTGD